MPDAQQNTRIGQTWRVSAARCPDCKAPAKTLSFSYVQHQDLFRCDCGCYGRVIFGDAFEIGIHKQGKIDFERIQRENIESQMLGKKRVDEHDIATGDQTTQTMDLLGLDRRQEDSEKRPWPDKRLKSNR